MVGLIASRRRSSDDEIKESRSLISIVVVYILTDAILMKNSTEIYNMNIV